MSFAMTSPLSTFVLVAVAAIAMSGCGVNVAFGGDATERIERETVDAGELDGLLVGTPNGAVSITGIDGDSIEIAAHLRERSTGDAEFTMTEHDGVLSVVGDCDDSWFENCRVEFEIGVPIGIDVEASTDNGRIELSGLGGDIDAETDNGEIEAHGLTGEQVSANTDNGRIDLDFDDAPDTVTAVTDNGAITIRVGGDEVYDVDAETDNGAVDVGLRTDPNAPRQIVARSDNGSIDIIERQP